MLALIQLAVITCIISSKLYSAFTNTHCNANLAAGRRAIKKTNDRELCLTLTKRDNFCPQKCIFMKLCQFEREKIGVREGGQMGKSTEQDTSMVSDPQ